MIRRVILPVCSLVFCINSSLIASDNKNDGGAVSKTNTDKPAVIRKNNSLKSIEKLLRDNGDSHDAYIKDLLIRIQNTKDALMCIIRKRNINKKDLKKEVDKFNNDVKEIVEKYNNLVADTATTTEIDADALPEASPPVKGHAIVTLDWRKRLRFCGIHNPIKELTSPLTEENVIEFINDNKTLQDSVLEVKNIPDSDVGCASASVNSTENVITEINDKKILG